MGKTDVPNAFPESISQHRQWFNGSFFVSAYAIAHISQITLARSELGLQSFTNASDGL